MLIICARAKTQVDLPGFIKHYASFTKKGDQKGLAGGRFVSAGRSSILAGRRFVSAGRCIIPAGRNFEFAGRSFVKKGSRFVKTGGRLLSAGQNFEKAVRSFEPNVGRLLLIAFRFYYFTVLNSSLLTCLYCGLVAPNNDFTYFFTSLAVSQRPFTGL